MEKRELGAARSAMDAGIASTFPGSDARERVQAALADTLDAPAPAKAAVKKTAKTAKRGTVKK